MDLLYVTTHAPWPCRDGGALRVWHQAEGLATRGHTVRLLSPPIDEEIPASADGRLSLAWLPLSSGQTCSLQAFCRGIPRLQAHHHSPAREACVADAAATTDLVLLDGLDGWALLPPGLESKSVIDFVDEVSLRYDERAQSASSRLRRFLLRWHAAAARRAEALCLQRLRGGWITTEADHARLATLGDASRVAVVPNGVAGTWLDLPRSPAAPPVLLFVGALSYPPNEDAACFLAGDIFPRVWRELPEAQLVLAGRGPVPPRLRALQGPQVRIEADVPDLSRLYERAAVAVIPMRQGTGMQNKLLEALAAGVPVVTTPRCVEGLSPDLAAYVGTGETAAALAGATLQLLQDPARAFRLAAAGREEIRHGWMWDRQITRLEHYLQECSAPS